MATEAGDLEKLQQAADEAARNARNVYLTFLLAGLYIAILIGSTTHEQLLRESGVTLPLLGVELPIVVVYAIVPGLFALLHFNLLLQLYLLSRKLHHLDGAIARLKTTPARLSARDRLYPFPFSQMLIGRQHGRVMRGLLKLMVWLTVLVLPVILLLWAQVRFLPYHSAAITWGAHRAVILADLVLLWAFWPRILDPKGRWSGLRFIDFLTAEKRPPKEQFRKLGAVALTFVAGFFSLFILAIPGEWDEEKWGYKPLTDCIFGERGYDPNVASVQKVAGLFTRTIDLRWAQLQGANLIEARLYGADLYGANLQGADLRGALLQGANLGEARLQGADLQSAQLQGANLYIAHLQGANLTRSQLQGAGLFGAHLQGADLSWALLQGADLATAHLQGANMYKVVLKGADLKVAQLQGANMDGAVLQGADMRKVQLHGAKVTRAWLYLADLRRASFKDLSGRVWEMFRNQVRNEVPKAAVNSRRNPRVEALDRLNAGEARNIAELSAHRPDTKIMFDWPFEKASQSLDWSPFGAAIRPADDNYVRDLTQYLVENVACRDKHAAKGIAQRALANPHYSDQKGLRPLLATALLKARASGQCPNIAALPTIVIRELRKMANAAKDQPAGQ